MKNHVTYWWELLIVCYHHAKFGGHRHSGRGDIMYLICRVISQDHAIRGSWIGPLQGKLRRQWHCGSGDVMVWFVI